jgi:cytidylate kinase
MAPKDIGRIRNITVSGRIGSGATTLAKNLAEYLGWDVLDGGKLMRKIQQDLGASVEETSKRPDSFDLEYEERIKKILREEKYHIIQSHLAGFDAQGIDGIFKIFVVCEGEDGEDRASVRIDRLVNRDGISVEKAKHEIKERDKQNLEKWRRLYAENDPNWVYWDKKYYDLIVNTYQLNKEDAFKKVLNALNLE